MSKRVSTRIWSSSLVAGSVGALVFASTGAAYAADGEQTRQQIEQRIERSVKRVYGHYRATHHLPKGAGVLVRLSTPRGTWTAKAGLPPRTARNPHYRIASVSKTFTAAAIMLLHQRGRLNLNDCVADRIPKRTDTYLPDVHDYAIPYRDRITIRQLLSHRAGVFDVFNDPIPGDAPVPYAGQSYAQWRLSQSGPDHQYTIDELAGVLSASGASYGPPNAQFHYSDTGYSLLVKIVERVAGIPFDRFVRKHLAAPIRLRQTSVVTSAYDNWLPTPLLSGWAKYVGTGWLPTMAWNMSDQVGPGSVVSSPSDMTRWISRLLSGRGPLTRATVRTMTRIPAGNTTYALGIGRTELGLGHSGAHPGYVNLVQYNPNDKVSVVVLTPFIDYTSSIQDHLDLLIDVGRRAKIAAGYPRPFAPPSSPHGLGDLATGR